MLAPVPRVGATRPTFPAIIGGTTAQTIDPLDPRLLTEVQSLLPLVRERLLGAGDPSWRRGLADCAFAFAVTRALILVVFTLSVAILPAKNSTQVRWSWPDLGNLLSQGDGGWYLDLAARGYDPGPVEPGRQANWTFFPLYPATIRLMEELGVRDGRVAGIVLSNAFSLGGLLFLWKIAEEKAGANVARRAVFYVSAFPTSIFLSGVWNMGLALFLLSASLYLLLRQRWAASSLAAALAVLARGQAIFMLAPLAWAVAMRGDWRARLRLAPYLLPIPAALGAFMLYMWAHTGNALAFLEVQKAWGRELDYPGRVIASFILHPRLVGQSTSAWDFTVINVLVAAASVVALPCVFRTFGGTVGLYAAATVLPLLPFSTLQAMDRYILLAFPLFMLLALWGETEWVDRLVSVALLCMLGFWATLFAAGYFPVLA